MNLSFGGKLTVFWRETNWFGGKLTGSVFQMSSGVWRQVFYKTLYPSSGYGASLSLLLIDYWPSQSRSFTGKIKYDEIRCSGSNFPSRYFRPELLKSNPAFTFRRCITLRRVVTSLVLFCLLSLAASSPLIWANSQLNTCSVTSPSNALHGNALQRNHVYLLVYEVLFPVLPLGIAVVAYFGIFNAARLVAKQLLLPSKL